MILQTHSFYHDANLGRSERRIWVAGALSILAILYIGAGSIQACLNIAATAFEVPWLNGYYYAAAGHPIANTLLALFMEWVPGTLFLVLGLWFVQTRLRERPLRKLITTSTKFRWKRLFFGFSVFTSLMVITWFIKHVSASGNQTSIFEASSTSEILGLEHQGVNLTLLIGLPFVLIFAPVNVVVQEMFFRGFADQGLSKILPNQTYAFALSACFFAFWHINNGEVYYGAIAYLLSVFAFGLLMSVVTSHDNGLEAAIGFHTANNLFFFLIVGQDGLGMTPTWLFTETDLPSFTIKTLLADCAFYFAAAMILVNLPIGLKGKHA